jgi:hypothetical protein
MTRSGEGFKFIIPGDKMADFPKCRMSHQDWVYKLQSFHPKF